MEPSPTSSIETEKSAVGLSASESWMLFRVTEVPADSATVYKYS